MNKNEPVNIAKMDHKTLILTQPKAQFLASGGTEEQFIKEAGFALQIIEGNKYLADLDKKSLVTAIVNVALTGLTLNPELKLGYLVPYKGKIYFRSSYMGKKEILLRAGVVQDVWANLVYEKDYFEIIEGTNRELIHRPDSFATDRGKVVGGYWCAILKNGIKNFDTMPVSRINEIRSRSESVKAGKGTPWDTDPIDMAKKTILNWGFKFLPKTGISDHILKAMEVEDRAADEEFKDWKVQQEKNTVHEFEEDQEADDTIVIVPEQKELNLEEKP